MQPEPPALGGGRGDGGGSLTPPARRHRFAALRSAVTLGSICLGRTCVSSVSSPLAVGRPRLVSPPPARGRSFTAAHTAVTVLSIVIMARAVILSDGCSDFEGASIIRSSLKESLLRLNAFFNSWVTSLLERLRVSLASECFVRHLPSVSNCRRPSAPATAMSIRSSTVFFFRRT